MSPIFPLLALLSVSTVPAPAPSGAAASAPVQVAQISRDELDQVTPGDEVDFIDPQTGAREFGTVQSTDDDSRQFEIRNDATGETHEVEIEQVLELDDF